MKNKKKQWARRSLYTPIQNSNNEDYAPKQFFALQDAQKNSRPFGMPACQISRNLLY